MKKKAYRLERTPMAVRSVDRSSLDWGNHDTLRAIDEYFQALLERESENIKALDLNPESLYLRINKL